MVSQDTWYLQFVHEAVQKEPERANRNSVGIVHIQV